jgi:exodeoxyribonuclease V alpha subunit
MTAVLPDSGPLTGALTAEILVPEDPFDARLAMGATGLLREFNEAGILTAADVHVAVRLGELGDEPDETVRLAIALAVRGVRSGSVCGDLLQVRQVDPVLPWPEPESWMQAVRSSQLVGEGKPLRWEFDLLYLDRYRRQEEQVRRDLLAREAQSVPEIDGQVLAAGLDRLFPGTQAQQQRLAAEVAATQWTTVLGGGPGTGKTTTVARVLALLLAQPGPPLRVALAAPTGKAAARLQAAVQGEARTFADPDRHDLPTLPASTLHRLLGWLPGGGNRFRHDRDNRLPFDVVVIDETSMVSLTMMARLLEALRPDARLILVGDPDQLASVEAGAVLADLVAGLTSRAGATATEDDGRPGPLADRAPPSGVVLLRKTWRFGGAIADLAASVRDGDPDAAVAVLQRGSDEVVLVDGADLGVRTDVVDAATAVREAALGGDAVTALDRMERHRLLCAHRTGPRGVLDWSRQIELWLADLHGGLRQAEWYSGRPVLVMKNDYAIGLFNGDTGVAVTGPEGALSVVFTREGKLLRYSPRRLAEVQTVHAMTVHRSQGSQFERVTFLLPEVDSQLSTRELLYTALTRAETFVRLVGTEAELRAAISRPAARASGLRLRLAQR